MAKTIFNILAICGAAGFSGVMLCIGVTLGGYWRTLPAQEFLDWFATNNQFLMAVITMVVPPTVLGMIGSLWMSWNSPSFRYWLLSALCITVIMVITFFYYFPANTAFSDGSVEIGEVSDRLNQWIIIHYVRIAFGVLASVLAVLALTNNSTQLQKR